jgi:7-carboxy-7-deazaguanine synthase
VEDAGAFARMGSHQSKEKEDAMFGQNQVRKREEHDGLKLQVREIFYTIQGEGPYAGLPAVFIRLTGCNLRCHFCDTKWDDEKDEMLGVVAILQRVLHLAPDHCDLVVITGGEPARQPLDKLYGYLTGNGEILKGTEYLDWIQLGARRFSIQVETSGSLWDPIFYKKDISVVVSPKTPRIDPRFHLIATAFKYVIRAGEQLPEDGLPMTSTQVKGDTALIARPENKDIPIYLSPCDEYNTERNAANLTAVAETCKKFGYRAGLQMHKYFGID